MESDAERRADLDERAARRVVEATLALGDRLTETASALHIELAESIPELRGDPMMLELLRASTESNIETLLHLIQHSIAIEGVEPPAAAVAYAQRLAQRGTSSNALVRAYRLGQRRVVNLAFAEIAHQESDADIAYAAARLLHDMAFDYIDQISEKVVAAYESERVRWLANRNTVRATMLASLFAGEDVDVAAAENALGYRLRQQHLGVLLWDDDRGNTTTALRDLEAVATMIADAVGGVGQPLFIPQDRSLGWAWIPLGRRRVEVDLDAVQRQVTPAAGSIRVALGSVGPAVPGFRSTHLEAARARTVATIAGERAAVVTTYDEPGVRAAALLAGDIGAARDLVANTLGPLAADDDAAERLRETVLVFLSEKGSYQSASERLHVHRNTVKYRVDRAVDVRGRPLDDDRFNLELALLACRWLGQAVLST